VTPSAKYGLLLFARKRPPSPRNSTKPFPVKPRPGPPVVSGPPRLTFGIPTSWAQVGLTPHAPSTPQLKIPILILVRPKRNSLSSVGLKVWVSVIIIWRVSPFSSPAPNPAVGKPGGPVSLIGKKLSRRFSRPWLLNRPVREFLLL